MGLLVEPGFSFPPAVWAWVGRCMVVVLLIPCLKSMGEQGESNVLMAFGSEMHLARVDCLRIAAIRLWEPLG